MSRGCAKASACRLQITLSCAVLCHIVSLQYLSRSSLHFLAGLPWAKTIKKNTNSTQNKSQTHSAKQYEVTTFLSADCDLSTETCSKNVSSLGVVFSCHTSGDPRGPSVVFEAVDIGPMPCPGPFHFSHSLHYIYDCRPMMCCIRSQFMR